MAGIRGNSVDENRNFEYNESYLAMWTSEETSNRCQSAVHNLTIIDVTREAIDDSAPSSIVVDSTVTVSDFSGKPNFCCAATSVSASTQRMRTSIMITTARS